MVVWSQVLETEKLPYSERAILEDYSNELKNTKHFNCTLNINVDNFITAFLTISSNYTKLFHVLSYIYRSFNNFKGKGTSESLPVAEL